MSHYKRFRAVGLFALIVMLQIPGLPQVAAQEQDLACSEDQRAVLTILFDLGMDTPFTRKECSLESGRNDNFPDSDFINLVTVAVEPGYRMRLYSEPNFAGVEHPPVRGMREVGELTVRSYIVEPIPEVPPSACVRSGGKAVLWEDSYYGGGNAHCVVEDRVSFGAASVRVASIHVEPGYKLLATVKPSQRSSEQRLFVSHEQYNNVKENGEPLLIGDYLLLSSWAVESVEDTSEGVGIVYRAPDATAVRTVTVTKRGAPGVVPRFRKTQTHIEYSTDDGAAWDPLVELAQLRGRDGEKGSDGLPPQLRRTTSHIEYSPDGGKDWDRLIALDALKGEEGDPGDPGEDRVDAFVAATSSCGPGDRGVMRYDADSSSLLVCDGSNWASFAKSGSNLNNLPIEDLGSAASVGGDSHTCAVLFDDSVRCWGGNNYGQAEVPKNLGPVFHVAIGHDHTCVLLKDGAIRCWGRNNYGQTEVLPNLSTARQVTSGRYHTCALIEDGAARCWGRNNYGQTDVPLELGAVRQVAAGGYHTCVLLESGGVHCWGRSTWKQTKVPLDLGVGRQIAAGWGNTCVLLEDGTVNCWGYYRTSGKTRAFSGDIGAMRQVVVGDDHICGLLMADTVSCLGRNYGGTTDYSQVGIPQGLESVRHIVTGPYHNCALLRDNSVRCWGRNDSGQSTVPDDLGPVRQL